jgi:CO/xanthine dehydrogenase FAD-binding subunit
VESLLNGCTVNDDLIRRAGAMAADEVDPPDDLHGDAAYRRGIVDTLMQRALHAAAQKRGR